MEIERMSAEEIRRNYREAKRKSQQISILADLNACKRADIKRIISGETDELPPISKQRPRNKGSGFPLTDEERQAIINMYLDGANYTRIAAETGRSYDAVSKAVKKYKESEGENMIFAEEQTAQKREQLTAEIEDKLNEQSSADEEPAEKSVALGTMDAPEIAAALMDLLLSDLQNFAVEIRIKDGSYIVRVASAEEEIIHTKRRAST